MLLKTSTILISVIITVSLIITGCEKKPSEPEDNVRWHFVSSLGTGMITGMYANENGTQLSVTNDVYFSIFTPGNTEPEKRVILKTTIVPGYYQYNPYINEDYYFYCDPTGQNMYIGNASDGEYIGAIPVTSLVDSINMPAKFIRTDDWETLNHHHIVTNGNGMYMIPIRQYDNIADSHQDDKLYFGTFSSMDPEPVFVVEHISNAYEELATLGTEIASNYYYSGYFWQYRRSGSIYEPPLTVVDESSYSTQHLFSDSIIKYVFEGNGFLAGLSYGKIKKSYDGGFTWEDWLQLNAAWDRVKIAGKDILFFSCNIASIDFDTIEFEDYDVGELHGHAITGLAEFDGKVFAGILDGLYYCDLEDAFKLKENNSSRKEESLNLEIVEE
ncbi:MAG: hypothetical protein K9N06_03900 [Candidatus Cloacimonetes bacterium]|nr:hypothetical protein [Candidatus Cloacimonadota bacterium]